MPVIITTEHFSLSEKSRRQVEDILERLSPVVFDAASIRLFLKKEPLNSLTAILHVHTRGFDFVSTKTGDDLEGLVNAAEAQVRKRLLNMKEKAVHMRKRAAS